MTVLIATVTVVFDGPAPPEALADALLAEPEVTTVRIGDHGTRSVFRADVEGSGAEAEAAAIADRMPGHASVLNVTLTPDAGRPLRLADRSPADDPH